MKSNSRITPPLKTLPVFISVAKHLSFTKAANELYVTHSAVSQRISQLENFLEKKLFIRSPRQSVELTTEGKRYFATIQKAITMINEATSLELGMQHSVLNVNVLPSLAVQWFIPRLSDFQASYPDLNLKISALNNDFSKGNVDIAIAYGYPDSWPGMYSKKLFDDSLVMVIANNNLSNTYDLESIFLAKKAIYVDAESRNSDWKLWCDSLQYKQPEKRNRIYFKHTSQALRAVTTGVGILVTHKPFVIDEIDNGILRKVNDHEVKLDKSYYLVCKEELLCHQETKIFTDWILSQASNCQ